MPIESLMAYKVTFDVQAGRKIHVVAARDIAEAAATVLRRLPSVQVQTLELIAPALVDDGGAARRRVEPAASSTPRPSAAPATKTGTTRKPRRRDQLVTALQDHRGPMHRVAIAEALGTSLNNAGNAITDALKHGLVRRVGSRTGIVELVQVEGAAVSVEPTTRRKKKAGKKTAPKPAVEPKKTAGKKKAAKTTSTKKRRRRGGLSHADRLVQLLRERGEPVHLDDLVQVLGTTRPTVQEVIRHAAKAGRVRRVGSRTGLVALPAAAAAEPAREASQRSGARLPEGTPAEATTEAPAPRQAAPVPASPAGLAARVVAALEEADGWVTGKDVAGAVGCRPREAGNALALLVERGLVERRRDGGGPATYRAVE